MTRHFAAFPDLLVALCCSWIVNGVVVHWDASCFALKVLFDSLGWDLDPV